MNLRFSLWAVCGLALFAAPSMAASRASDAPVTSRLEQAGEFSGCRWEKVSGSRFSISSFACGAEQGGMRLIADDALPGFWLTGNDGSKDIAIRFFTKAKKAPIIAALPAIKAVSAGPQTLTCTLATAPNESQGRLGSTRYVLQPSGADLKAWEAAQDRGDAVEEPCGPLGVAMVGDRYFEVLRGHPDVVTFVNMGSEIQIFDPATLRRVTKP